MAFLLYYSGFAQDRERPVVGIDWFPGDPMDMDVVVVDPQGKAKCPHCSVELNIRTGNICEHFAGVITVKKPE